MFKQYKMSIDNPVLESFDFHVEENVRQFLGQTRKRVLGVLRLVYTSTSETGIKKLTIPRATIPLLDSIDSIDIEGWRSNFTFDDDSGDIDDRCFTADLFGTKLKLEKDARLNASFIVEDIPKPKKMTVEEIEKALGYKVEIISNE